MSTTTAGGPAGVDEIGDVAAYAQAVRRHLVGLTPEQVDDLTDDLEADLADTLADSSRGADGADVGAGSGSKGGDLVARFGPPAAYAAELRSAAGLPDAAATGRRTTVRARLSRAVRTRVASAHEVLRSQAWWDPVSAFVISLRPFGWVVRGWVAFQVLDAVRDELVSSYGGLDAWPGGLPAQLVLIAMVVVSVQWGRDRWLPAPWIRSVRHWVTVLAIVALLPVLASIQPETTYVEVGGYTETVYVPSELQDGVVVDGMAVSNLFVYDADGNPLEDVQIYDDRGRPVRTTADDGSGEWSLPGVDEPWSFRPVQDEDGRTRWNVYPLHGAPSSSFEWSDGGLWMLVDGATTRVPPRPFAKAPAVVGPEEADAADSEAPADTAASPQATAGATAGSAAIEGRGAGEMPSGAPDAPSALPSEAP